ncbi:TIGR02300 family protein [Sphingomonas limnosediminicola]|uniref:TIGR02300 family protein n=2 Tax=Sphingomonas limnosediminicola TaxID=940133 RepID=A0ABP7LVW8_9SPHN
MTGGYAYGKAPRRTLPQSMGARANSKLETFFMVKPEWGSKRTCPKCSTRFYDLGNDDPVHCINCGTDFVPEPVLKSKQPMAFEAAPVAAKEPAQDDELAAEDLAVDEDAEISPDEEVDLETGDNDLGVETGGEDDES